MGTKTITITEDAYDSLKEHKREDESFTDTIIRITGADRDVMKGFGAMKGDGGFAEAVGRTRDDLEDAFEERRERRAERGE